MSYDPNYKGRSKRYGVGIKILETGEVFETRMECARRLNVSPQYISDGISGRVDSVKGYHLQVVDITYNTKTFLEILREQSYKNGDNCRWAEHPYYKEVIVSDTGRVYTCGTGLWRELRSSINNGGYLTAYVHGKNRTVHRLVAETFIPNPYNKSFVNHIDGDKTNNDVYNLEWCTASENEFHAYKNGLKRPHHKGRMVRIKETNEVFDTIRSCAESVDGHGSGISRCLNNQRNTHRGYHYEYVDEEEYYAQTD